MILEEKIECKEEIPQPESVSLTSLEVAVWVVNFQSFSGSFFPAEFFSLNKWFPFQFLFYFFIFKNTQYLLFKFTLISGCHQHSGITDNFLKRWSIWGYYRKSARHCFQRGKTKALEKGRVDESSAWLYIWTRSLSGTLPLNKMSSL